MLQDCLEVFEKQLEKDDSIVLKSYMPVDGTYVILKPEEDDFVVKDIVDIKYNKKQDELEGRNNIHFNNLCFYDYNSKLIDMNKPIDPKKIIHSNNYLSFYIKKDNLTSGKLTKDIIENYYNILKNPYLKYSAKKAKAIYKDVEDEIGKVNIDEVDKIQNWIMNNIFNLPFEVTGKDYLKIFFLYPNEDYEREGKRYLIPNIYNSNDLNIVNNNKIYGMPNDNIGLNSKKPYLENKTRKVSIPYLLDTDEVLKQRKLFDYLMNYVAQGYVNIYIDEDKISAYKNGDIPRNFESGRYLRIQKGKEVEIHNYDVITNFQHNLKNPFKFKNYLKLNPEKVSLEDYKVYKNKSEMQTLINEVIFSKYLVSNYFTEPKDIRINNGILKNSLLISRNAVFDWLYKGANNGIYNVLENALTSVIKGNILEGNLKKASHQLNLKCSIKEYKGDNGMANMLASVSESLRSKIRAKNTSGIENDEEYYFAMGQLVAYLISKNRGSKKPQSLVNPFLTAKSDEVIKAKISNLYKKYNHDIEFSGRRFNNLYSMVKGYKPDGKYNVDMFEAGFLHSNLIYEKDEEEKING